MKLRTASPRATSPRSPGGGPHGSRSHTQRVERALAPHHWLWRSEPFPHVVARDVFLPKAYREMEAAFRRLLHPAARSRVRSLRFSRNMRGYDATGITFGSTVPDPFALMFSRPWHDLLGRLFGVAGTGYMSGGLHHHEVGSANGAVHNDLNPGWFERQRQRGGVTVADERSCAYKTGYSAVPGLRTVEQIRGVAMLFYLNNPEWSSGDGGETGLYWHATDAVDCPAASVPPINNSLLAFECTPYSYHSFISNRRHARDSLVLWIHRAKREVLSRWGDGAICYWQA